MSKQKTNQTQIVIENVKAYINSHGSFNTSEMGTLVEFGKSAKASRSRVMQIIKESGIFLISEGIWHKEGVIISERPL